MSKKLVIDFESFWDTKNGYTLRKMSMVEYVRSPLFKAFGLGYQWGNDEGFAEPGWISNKNIHVFVTKIAWSRIDVIAHNAKFDGFILKQVYGIQPRRWIDTKGMSRAVLGKRIKNHSLATLAEHFDLESKGTMKTDGLKELTPDQEAELASYCLHDVELCSQIYSRLADNFPENQYEMLHRTVQMFVNPKIELNVELLKQTAESERERKKTIFSDMQIDKAFFESGVLKGGYPKLLAKKSQPEINKDVFSSNIMFPRLLEWEGFDAPKKFSPKQKNEDGSPKEIAAIALGDPDFLNMLEGENERLRSLCEARVAAKSTLLETRSEKLSRLGSTGLWPFDVEYSGANQTHRFSGGSGAGGNPQNFSACRDGEAHKLGHECPGRLRTAVQAPAGYSLIVGDFSNIELRLVAYLSKDPGLIEAIEQDKDIYCDFASVFYGRTITKKDEIERRFGKTAILGLGYGMGATKFKKTVRLQTGQDISIADAERAVDVYRSRYTRVPQLWHVLNSSIPLLARDEKGLFIGMPIRHEREALVLPSGLKMRYPNLRSRPGDHGPEWVYDVWTKRKSGTDTVKLYGGKVLENISQGLAGELCKEVAQQFGDHVTGLVHDEIHLVVRKGQEKLMAARLERIMSTAPSWFPRIKLNAEVGYGRNWLDAK